MAAGTIAEKMRCATASRTSSGKNAEGWSSPLKPCRPESMPLCEVLTPGNVCDRVWVASLRAVAFLAVRAVGLPVGDPIWLAGGFIRRLSLFDPAGMIHTL